MNNNFKVAAIQMDCHLGQKGENLIKAKGLILQAVSQGAILIVLPELFSTGYRVEELDMELAETIPGYTSKWMEELSQSKKIYLIGSILERSIISGIVYDTAVVTGPNGFIGSYRKIHLWDSENTRWAKGKEYPIFDLGFARLGVQICYEIGFPEGSRVLSLKGADVIAYPSAFGKARLYAWDVASRSRALENAVYAIAANRVGNEKETTEFGGSSRIVDPQGRVMVEATNGDEVIVASVDLSFIQKQRQTIPYLRDLNGGPDLGNK